jgi:hypothetical protein
MVTEVITMKTKKTRLKCAVNGCRNRDTFYISKSGVYFNSPNICKECAKTAYEALFADEIKAEAEKAKKAEKVVVSEKENATEDEEKDKAETEKKVRKKEA